MEVQQYYYQVPLIGKICFSYRLKSTVVFIFLSTVNGIRGNKTIYIFGIFKCHAVIILPRTDRVSMLLIPLSLASKPKQQENKYYHYSEENEVITPPVIPIPTYHSLRRVFGFSELTMPLNPKAFGLAVEESDAAGGGA